MASMRLEHSTWAPAPSRDLVVTSAWRPWAAGGERPNACSGGGTRRCDGASCSWKPNSANPEHGRVGRLAGGLAHDFNNILTIVGGYGELAAADLSAVAPGASQRERGAAGRRACGRHHQAVAGVEPATGERSAGGLTSITSSSTCRECAAARVRGNRAPRRCWRPTRSGCAWIRASSGRPAEPGRACARGDGDQWSPHDPASARLRPTILRGLLTRGFQRPVRGPDGERPGSPASARSSERLFEPFLPVGSDARGGDGLGLAQVYGIVRQSGGIVEATSGRDGGTTFRIFLPLGGQPRRVRLGRRPAEVRRRGRPCCWWNRNVESDIRPFGARASRYIVATRCPTGADALIEAEGRRPAVDLLVGASRCRSHEGRAVAWSS